MLFIYFVVNLLFIFINHDCMLAARAVGQPLNRYSIWSSVSDCWGQFASWVQFLRCWVTFTTELIICKMTFIVFLLIGWFVYWQLFNFLIFCNGWCREKMSYCNKFFCLGPLFTVVVLVAKYKDKMGMNMFKQENCTVSGCNYF